MTKGVPQSRRNNAWHLRHTKKKASDRVHRMFRLSEYRAGNPIKRGIMAEKQFKEALAREKKITVGFWKALKYMFLMAKLKLKNRIRTLFTFNQNANA